MKNIFKKIVLTRKILWLEGCGMVLCLLFIWIDEILDLPHRFFNAPPTPINTVESLWESAMIIVIFGCIILATLALTRKLHKLEGLIPICSRCKKIRSNDGQWMQVEEYISKYSGSNFTHGLCRECLQTLYPEIAERIQNNLDQENADSVS